ncbi:ABC transporter substrate-binding protein [Cryobacterium sp. SO1]|uniref:ABC transporter substrate-binding protein n=1 Tax=Cryobacterium sp. SO1 TaxID=1897061 RepID=UPI0010ECA12C|nr:sugar ABC transporter substrate-binding protein [Cryobacterium sp. SO1]RZI34570.1 sn-glycerol-3-phosphate-binding periplasmic protein UgpB [Cryobacterium sp. SO1]
MKKLPTIGFALAGVVAIGLTGCGLGSGTSTDSGSSSDEITGEITFSTLQLKPTFTDYIEGVIDDFETANPGTAVKWIDVPFDGAQEKISTDAQAGTLPDVINLNPNFAQPLEAQGAFVNLDDAMPGLSSKFVTGAWDAFQVPGEDGSFGFPWYLSSEVTMYNSSMFETAGLDPNSPPATYDELFADARTLAGAGADFTGMHPALENRFITDLGRMGVPLMNKAGTEWTFNTPDAEAYVAELADLYQSGVFPPDSLTQDHAKETEAYQAGQIALFPSGANFLTIIEENAPDIAKATNVGPQITSEGGPTNVSVMGLLVPKSSENKATALAFAEYITNAENQLAFSKIVTIFPSVTEALADPYFMDDSDGTVESKARRIAAEQLPDAENIVPVQFDDRIKAIVIGKVQLAMKGDLTPAEALDQAVEEANAVTAK